MENRQYNPLYLLVAALGILLLLLIGVFYLLKGSSKKISVKETPTAISSPTPVKITPFENKPTIEATSTGALLGDIPQSTIDLTNQKKELRNKTPLKEKTFTITFDFVTDRFIVTLNEPRAENRVQFETWLKTSYPAIPLDRFNFK